MISIKDINLKNIKSVDKLYSQYTGSYNNNYEIITSNGEHIVNIAPYVEVWKLEQHCFLFEDRELVASFVHQGKPRIQLMDYSCLLYYKKILPNRVKH